MSDMTRVVVLVAAVSFGTIAALYAFAYTLAGMKTVVDWGTG